MSCRPKPLLSCNLPTALRTLCDKTLCNMIPSRKPALAAAATRSGGAGAGWATGCRCTGLTGDTFCGSGREPSAGGLGWELVNTAGAETAISGLDTRCVVPFVDKSSGSIGGQTVFDRSSGWSSTASGMTAGSTGSSGIGPAGFRSVRSRQRISGCIFSGDISAGRHGVTATMGQSARWKWAVGSLSS